MKIKKTKLGYHVENSTVNIDVDDAATARYIMDNSLAHQWLISHSAKVSLASLPSTDTLNFKRRSFYKALCCWCELAVRENEYVAADAVNLINQWAKAGELGLTDVGQYAFNRSAKYLLQDVLLYQGYKE